MNVSMIGDWGKFDKSISAMVDRKLIPLMKVSIGESGKLVLKTLVGHVQTQDLNWAPLSVETLDRKSSALTFLETGELINNLVMQEVVDKADRYTVFVGAPNTVHSPSGERYSDIMLYMEFGTLQNPARPLIQPTFDELRRKITDALIEAVKSALVK